MSNMKLAGLAIGAALALLAVDAVVRRGQMAEGFAADITKIIDKADAGNTIKPSSVSIPLSMALPISVASQWEGYFTMARKNGSVISDTCAAMGVPFTVRTVADGQYGIEIAPDNAQKIWDCQ
ncbi:hypothetical protein NKJ26_03405 [Mesorhizobium sp. M0152]|uniref:hypothetical protein n=1 Tax=Mesorhizobium sp. M0152 TaxID=2956898 RepID=UPI003335B58A